MAEDKNGSGVRDLFLRTIAVVGLVAVLLLGAWGIILIAFNLPNLFGTLGASVGSLFTLEEQVETTTPPTDSAPQQPPTLTPPSTTKTTTAKATNTKYVASGKYGNLYGTSDLAVRIISVLPAGNLPTGQAGRTNVQFEITNAGTNVTPSNWSFEAQLPTQPTYTYQSVGQQALYPGDKIVYTIGFDTPYNYYNSGTCYHYDGFRNYPTTCPGYSYQNWYGYAGRVVTIVVDRYNLVADYNRANNTASVAI